MSTTALAGVHFRCEEYSRYGSTVYIGMGGQHYSVLKEILIITFSLWCMRLLTN